MEKHLTQIEIILYVFGDVFDPTDLTEHIQITPTEYWCKGDKIPPIVHPNVKDTIPRFRKDSTWKYSTGFIQTFDSDEVSDIIVGKFWDKLPKLANYMEKKELEASIYFVVKIVDEQAPALGCNLKLIEMAQQLKAEIHMDMYVFCNDCEVERIRELTDEEIEQGGTGIFITNE